MAGDASTPADATLSSGATADTRGRRSDEALTSGVSVARSPPLVLPTGRLGENKLPLRLCKKKATQKADRRGRQQTGETGEAAETTENTSGPAATLASSGHHQSTEAKKPKKPRSGKKKKAQAYAKAAQQQQQSREGGGGEDQTGGHGAAHQKNPAGDQQQQQQEKTELERERARSPIRQPSEASGGVPEPTAAYLYQASQPPIVLDTSQHHGYNSGMPSMTSMTSSLRHRPLPLLVVMDLNGTLLYRPSRRRAPKQFVLRPHAAQFLDYCLHTFWVVIWSSARPGNVDAMCRQMLQPHQRRGVVAVWGRDRFGLSEEDYNSRVQCYKRLSQIWADPAIRASYPQSPFLPPSGQWSQANTVLIDDSLEKARTEPFNLIAIPEFQGNGSDAPDKGAAAAAAARMKNDTVLPQVHDYLNSLCYQTDVSAYMRMHPFRAIENT